jgi:hypothetical protein
MATRLKTVHYAFPAITTTVTNNTLTNLTQITVYLPETGTKTFRSVVAHFSCDDIITNTGGTITTKTSALRLGAAAYTTIANANALTNTGENLSLFFSQDFTSHFVTNWTGTSMTCDFQFQINQSTGTTTGMTNVCVTLEITYAYDDTSTTQVKSVFIPLNMPTGAMDTAATTRDTIPALDTFLPEASKVFRNIHVILQGNEQRNGATTDHTMTLRVGAASQTTGNYEGALASDRFIRYVWELTAAYPSTASTQTWQPTATVARCNHMQAWMVVTYEYNESTSTSIMNSVFLPMEIAAPMGGTTSADYQKATRELFIEEPATITTQDIAFYVFWTEVAAIGGLNMRVGSGAFVTYTDAGGQLCGSCAAMVRNDSAFTLARGRNELNFDVYRTDTADYGWNMSGFWLVNYTSGKHSSGSGAHNHTIFWGLLQKGTGAGVTDATVAATAPIIPETNYYINAAGTRLQVTPSGTSLPIGIVLQVERLSAEGGVAWDPVYQDLQQTDIETGVFFALSQMKKYFKRWVGDVGPDRMDIETARRWKIFYPWQSATTAAGWSALSICLTYHSITYTVSGTITGSGGGTVTLNLCRTATGERVLSTSRVGNGTYSFTWIDNVESLYVEAREGANYLGRSDDGVAT